MGKLNEAHIGLLRISLPTSKKNIVNPSLIIVTANWILIGDIPDDSDAICSFLKDIFLVTQEQKRG